MHQKFFTSLLLIIFLVLAILTGPAGVSAANLSRGGSNLNPTNPSAGLIGFLSPQTIHYKLTITTVGNGTALANPSKGTYSDGEPVTLIATPDPGYIFAGWSGDLNSMDNPAVLAMDSDKAVIATFIPTQYMLNVTPVGNGSVNIQPNQPTYPSGSVVTLSASADPGWSFAGWSGDLSGAANPVDVTINGDTSIIATFTQDEYLLTVTVNGSGTVSRNPDQATYHYGDWVTLTPLAATGWAFSNWGGIANGSENPLSIQILADTPLAADFTAFEYSLTIGTSGSGSVTRDPDQATYHYGDTVNLSAVPAPGWSFNAWGGMATGSDNPLSLQITGNTSVSAGFSQNIYTLGVNISGNGSVSKSPSQAAYPYGGEVQLTPTADPGWFFVGWGGDLTGNANPGFITMDGDKVVTAAFMKVEANLGLVHANLPALVGSSRNWTITLIVSNVGPLAAADLSLVDTLPVGAALVSASGVGWTCQAGVGQVTCGLPALASGDSSELTIIVKAPLGPAMITNQALVTSNLPDFTMGDNTSTAIVEVSSLPIGGPIIFIPILSR